MNTPVIRNNETPVYTPNRVLSPGASPRTKTLLKITFIALAIGAIGAIVATVLIGAPIMVPIGIGIGTLILNSMVLGAYKYLSKSKFQYKIGDKPETPPTHQLPDQKIFKEEIKQILSSNPDLNATDIYNIRKKWMQSNNWIQRDDIEEALKQSNLALNKSIKSSNTSLHQFEAKTSKINILLSRDHLKQTSDLMVSPFQFSSEHTFDFRNVKGIDLTFLRQEGIDASLDKFTNYFILEIAKAANSNACFFHISDAILFQSDTLKNAPDELKDKYRELMTLGLCLALDQFASLPDQELPNHFIVSLDNNYMNI